MKGIYIFDENGDLEETIIADSFFLLAVNDLRIRTWSELPDTRYATLLSIIKVVDEYRELNKHLSEMFSMSPKVAKDSLRIIRKSLSEIKVNYPLPAIDFPLLAKAALQVKRKSEKENDEF